MSAPLHVYWFIPSHGDGRRVARTAGGPDNGTAAGRDPDLSYLAQVARAADRLGFTGALVPAGLFCEDAWLVAAALMRETDRLRFMVALRPGLVAPTLVAQMSATFQRMSGGRLLLNVVAGGDLEEQHRYGDWLDHDQRYARAEEFLRILRGAWSGRYDLAGEHYRVAGATVIRPPDPPPGVFLGGSSPAARRVAALLGDVYLMWGEPPPQTASQLDQVRALAGERRLEYGTRFHVICRDTAEQAWAVADRMVADLDPALVAASQQRFRGADSEGQRRVAALHDGRPGQLEVYPNLWAGFGLARQGPGLALVGSHEDVADRIAEYHRLGVRHLILSGQPHLEEAYWFGEGVLPILRARGVVAPSGAG